MRLTLHLASSTAFPVYLLSAFNLLRGTTSQTFDSAAASSTIPLSAASSTLTSSSEFPELAAQTSVLPGAATSNFCHGISSDCYITTELIPTISATCSGTSDSYAIYVTDTITVGQYVTISGNFSTPQPVYITPLPFCTNTSSSSTSTTSRYQGNNISSSNILNGNSTSLVTTAQPISTTETASTFLFEGPTPFPYQTTPIFSIIYVTIPVGLTYVTVPISTVLKTPIIIQQSTSTDHSGYLEFGPRPVATSPTQVSNTDTYSSPQLVSSTSTELLTTTLTSPQLSSPKSTVPTTILLTSPESELSTSTGPTATFTTSPQPISSSSTGRTTASNTYPRPVSSSSTESTTTSTTFPQRVSSTSTGPTTTSPVTPGLGGIILSAFNNPSIPPDQIPMTSEISPINSQQTSQIAKTQGLQPASGLVSNSDNISTGSSPSSVIIDNVPIQVGPGSVVIGGQTISPATVTAPVIISGQTFSIFPSQVVAPGGIVLSIPASNPPAPTNVPSVLTIGGQQFTQTAPSQLQVSGSTIYIPLQGTTAVVGDKTYTIYPSLIAGSGITFTLPVESTEVPAAEEFTAVTAAGLTFDLGPSEAVISGTTYEIGAGVTPTAIVGGSGTVTLGPSGLVLPATTIAPPPAPPPSWSTISADGLVFSVQPGDVYISSSEYTVGNGAHPTTILVGEETVAIDTEGVILPSTTIVLASATLPTWSTVSVNGLVFSIEPGEVYISSTEYIIGSGATSTTLVIGEQIVAIGTEGVVLYSTIIASPSGILQTWSAVSVDSLVFSIEPGEVYISSTEYALGSEATPTTFVVNNETVVVGSNGVILPSTTIALPTETGFDFTGIGSGLTVNASIYWGSLLIAFVGGVMLL